jgi:coenzyme PQQ precursor peptide PqqA
MPGEALGDAVIERLGRSNRTWAGTTNRQKFAYMGCIKLPSALGIIGGNTMAWTTPTLIEICIGLEINGYLPAEF